MKFFNILYFYYYLFYKRVLKDEQPIFTTAFTLSFSMSLLVNGIVNIVLAHTLGEYLHKWAMISVFLGLLALGFFYYIIKNKAIEVIKNKPKILNSHTLSMVLTVLFFTISVSFLFWEPIYSKNIIDGK